jgi:hypothetical protein
MVNMPKLGERINSINNFPKIMELKKKYLEYYSPKVVLLLKGTGII